MMGMQHIVQKTKPKHNQMLHSTNHIQYLKVINKKQIEKLLINHVTC
jgi:hypothetical protein